MWCSGLEVGRHKHFQQRSLLCLLLAPTHRQTPPFPRQRARRLLSEHWRAKHIGPVIPPLTGSLTGLTLLLAPRAPAVGQSLQKKKKNDNSNSNRLNYISYTGDRSWSVTSFNSLWSRNTKLHHPEVKWGPVTTHFTPVARGEAQRHTQITTAGAAPEAAVSPGAARCSESCQLCLKESDMTHMAPAGLRGAARLRALEELAGINQRMRSSSCSPKSAAGKNGSRCGLGLAASCHAPCSRWQVQLGSDLLGSHQPCLVLSNSHQKYWQ